MRQAYQDEDEASYQNKVDIGNKYRKGTTMRPNWHDLFYLYICLIFSLVLFILFVISLFDILIRWWCDLPQTWVLVDSDMGNES